VAALAMVVISFGLHFLAIGRGRVSESAIMQANGLPWRVVDQGLLAEQLVVLCHSLVVGGALGALLAWAILPVIQTSFLPADTIPPTVLSLDVTTLAAAAAALLAGAALVGQVAMRSASRFRLHDELRAIA
jgi:predicted lysophospholipase L1 biosynthesis ABC-type transport system permease subunit